MNNNIQCSIESSTTKIELNSAVEGVFLVPELEGLAGLPEIRTTSGVNAGYDGGWTSAQNYDARLISIRGVIANPDISKVEDKRRAIASLLGQGRKEQLTLRFTTEAGNAYAISVRTISCEMALQRVLTTQEFLIQLRADDPLIYDDGTTGGIAAILQPQRALGGFEINFDLPLAIGGGAEDTVVDNGNETVYPVIKLYGALHSPTVVNRTTNQQMQILADLQYSIDWHTYRSTTGDYILVNGGLDGAPMTLSQLLGNAKQTTYSGKNLFNFTEFAADKIAGGTGGVTRGTATVSGNSITITATGNDAYTSYANNFPPEITVTPNTDMVLSWTSNATLSNDGNVYVFGKSEGGVGTIGYAKARAGFYAFNTGSFSVIKFRLGVETSGNSITYSNIQMEYGSTSTSYEPYVGGTVSPNPDYPQDINVVTGGNTVVIYGQNSLSAPQDYTEDRDGLVFTCTGGIYNIRGNASSGIVTADHDIAQPYTIREGDYWHLCNDFTDTHIQIALVFTDGSIRNYSPGVANRIESLSTDAGKTVSKIRFYYNSGYGINGNIKPMILNGVSTATGFIPYQGQSHEINLGKNLCSGMELGWLYGTDGSERANTSSVQTIRSGFIRVQPNTTYIISSPDYTGTWFWYEYKADKSYNLSTNKGNSTGIFTTEPNTYWVRFRTNTPYADLSARFQLERGSQATSYASYFTPIELAKIGTYQDRIYKDDGKWYIEKQVGKVVFDGSENITLHGTVDSIIGVRLPIPNNALHNTVVLCDYFHYVPFGVYYGVDGDRTYGTITTHNTTDINTLYASSPNSAVTDVAGFKTWLGAHNITVYYVLATPTTTEITDEALLLQLNFLASLYGGVNNISLVGTGAQGEMTIRYATDYTVNQDIITIDSQARTITLNGQDVYHLKTSESEFLVLAPGENKLYLTSEVSDDSGYAEVKFKQGYLSI